jgi:hypothetical protein
VVGIAVRRPVRIGNSLDVGDGVSVHDARDARGKARPT